MSSAGRKTLGFGIRYIRLIRADFSSPEEVAHLALAGSGGEAEIQQSIGEREIHDDGFSVSLSTTVIAKMEGKECWRASVEYVGRFVLSAGAEVMPDIASKVQAPAYLYGYARECVADLVRRAGLGALAFPPLPPWNFLEASQQPGEPSSDES